MNLTLEFGDRIRAVRAARGLSQAQVAATSGIHVKLLARIESGRHRNVTLRTLERLAHGLDMEVHNLLDLKSTGRASAEVSAVLSLLRGADKPTRSCAVSVVKSVVRLGRRQPTDRAGAH